MPRQILDPRHYRLDELLRRPYTPTTPFGASGDCLWATSPQGWGFDRGVHWLHKTGADGLGPLRLTLYADGEPLAPEDAIYRPSHVTLNARHPDSGLQVTEDKFLTRDDVVVSVISVRNPSYEAATDLEIDLQWGITGGAHELRKGISVYVHREGPPGDDLHQRLPPGGRRTFVFAVAFAPTREEAVKRAASWARDPNPAGRQAAEYQVWFDENVPLFDCSDLWLTKLWYHRWYVVRKNHSCARVGLLQEDSFSEGRWGVEWYTATITYGAGHVLRELRWLRDPRYAQNYFRGFARTQREDGLFRSFYVDGIARPDTDQGKYTDWITAAVRDVHAVHPDTAFLREALPHLEKNVGYWQSHETDGDGLLTVDDHWWTGMEWQPSFFARADFRPGEKRDGRDVQNPVKRLDLTSYQYANARALADVQRLLGNADAARTADALADRIRAAALAKMWDAADALFYDLLPGTDEKLKAAKTVAAYYPFYAGLAGAEQAGAWRALADPALFRTPHPPASTAQDSPAYAQDGTMRGHRLTGCYWNGPTWPHANSLVISGLARFLHEHGDDADADGPDPRRLLLDLVTSFGRAQFEEGDYARPHTGEFYRGDTDGPPAWLTRERDYHHSTWADLILGGIVGIRPGDDPDTLFLHPLLPPPGDGGWSHFCAQGVPYKGRSLTIVWDNPAHPEDAYQDGDKGLTVYCDGRRVHHQDDLSPCAVSLPV